MISARSTLLPPVSVSYVPFPTPLRCARVPVPLCTRPPPSPATVLRSSLSPFPFCFRARFRCLSPGHLSENLDRPFPVRARNQNAPPRGVSARIEGLPSLVLLQELLRVPSFVLLQFFISFHNGQRRGSVKKIPWRLRHFRTVDVVLGVENFHLRDGY